MHIRCPHCHHPVEVVGDGELSDVTGPSCGSEFSLIPATEIYSPTTRSIAHFDLHGQPGTGSFGSVWKARDTQLDRLVAVKIPRRDQSGHRSGVAHAERTQRFRLERGF